MVRINQLPEGDPLDGTELFPAWQAGRARRVGVEAITADAVDAANAYADSLAVVVNVKTHFEAVGNNVVDDTAAIQAAIDAVDAQGGGEVLFPSGTYRITSTLTWQPGVSLRGITGSAFVPSRHPEISWFGPADTDMMETLPSGGTTERTRTSITNLVFRNGGGHPTPPRHGVVIHRRADLTGFWIDGFQVAGVTGDGIRFEEGCLNGTIIRSRFDIVGGYGIYLKALSWSNLAVFGCTYDNSGTTNGGFFHLDNTGGTANDRTTLHFDTVHLEPNAGFASSEHAPLKFTMNPEHTGRHMVEATFTNVNTNIQGGKGILVTPDWDYVDFTLINCRTLPIEGVPAWRGRLQNNSHHVFTVISPHTLTAALSPETSRGSIELFGDVNLQDIYQYGRRQAPIIFADPSDASWDDAPVRVQPGQLFLPPTSGEQVQGPRKLRMVRTQGTLGTLSGVTGTGGSGQNQLVVNDMSTIRVGDWLVVDNGVDGPENRRVMKVESDISTLTLHTNLTNAHSGSSVTYLVPQLLDVWLTQKRNTAPTTGTWERGDVVWNQSATAGGKAGWICVTAGTPGTWKPFGAIDA